MGLQPPHIRMHPAGFCYHAAAITPVPSPTHSHRPRGFTGALHAAPAHSHALCCEGSRAPQLLCCHGSTAPGLLRHSES